MNTAQRILCAGIIKRFDAIKFHNTTATATRTNCQHWVRIRGEGKELRIEEWSMKPSLMKYQWKLRYMRDEQRSPSFSLGLSLFLSLLLSLFDCLVCGFVWNRKCCTWLSLSDSVFFSFGFFCTLIAVRSVENQRAHDTATGINCETQAWDRQTNNK